MPDFTSLCIKVYVTVMRYAFGLEQVLYTGLLGGSVVMKSPANAGDARDTGLIPGSGGSPRVVNCNPL